MEAGDAAPATRPAPASRPVIVPTLKDCCINTLSKYRQYLGDVGFVDPESLRSVLWHCNPDQLAHIEDETLIGSDRNLEWYTWHLWKRHLKTDFGDGGLQAPDLESEQPVDYQAPRGISDEPGDFRTLYLHRKAEMEERTAAAKERIAAAQQQVQEAKESRKAKMIDKLAPAKRSRCSSGAPRGSTPAGLTSAYLHKPRADSRSSVMRQPGAQLKLLSELGLVKKAPPRSTTTVRVIKPSPVPSAAVGHSSSLAGAQLLSKATGGQLGRTGVMPGSNGGRGLNVPAQLPQAAARAAAVAAVAAARSNSSYGAGSSSGGSSSGRPSPPAQSHGSANKRLAEGPAGAPSSKLAATGVGRGGDGAGPSRPDPRVMFPRQAPPSSAPGQSKFAVPTARPLTTMGSPSAAGDAPASRTGPRPPGAKSAAIRPFDDL